MLLAELPDYLLLLRPKHLSELCQCVLLVLSSTSAALQMCPVVIAQVVTTREPCGASRYCAREVPMWYVLGLDVSSKVLWANETTVAVRFVAYIASCI